MRLNHWDKTAQQAIAQVLTPIFSEASFGFRPNRGAHDVLKNCQRYADEGYIYVVDKELERRWHKFVRYADDCMILCKSRRSAERTLSSIIPFIEKKLFLKVNREKISVAYISKVKYLGYGFYRYKGKCRFKVHKKSLAKMKERLRAITNRSKAISNEERPLILKRYVKGWVNYFKLADWMVHELANCRKGIWRALMLNNILTKKEIAR